MIWQEQRGRHTWPCTRVGRPGITMPSTRKSDGKEIKIEMEEVDLCVRLGQKNVVFIVVCSLSYYVGIKINVTPPVLMVFPQLEIFMEFFFMFVLVPEDQ
jgi:hypothetical protein